MGLADLGTQNSFTKQCFSDRRRMIRDAEWLLPKWCSALQIQGKALDELWQDQRCVARSQTAACSAGSASILIPAGVLIQFPITASEPASGWCTWERSGACPDSLRPATHRGDPSRVPGSQLLSWSSPHSWSHLGIEPPLLLWLRIEVSKYITKWVTKWNGQMLYKKCLCFHYRISSLKRYHPRKAI